MKDIKISCGNGNKLEKGLTDEWPISDCLKDNFSTSSLKQHFDVQHRSDRFSHTMGHSSALSQAGELAEHLSDCIQRVAISWLVWLVVAELARRTPPGMKRHLTVGWFLVWGQPCMDLGTDNTAEKSGTGTRTFSLLLSYEPETSNQGRVRLITDFQAIPRPWISRWKKWLRGEKMEKKNDKLFTLCPGGGQYT